MLAYLSPPDLARCAGQPGLASRGGTVPGGGHAEDSRERDAIDLELSDPRLHLRHRAALYRRGLAPKPSYAMAACG